MKSACGLTQLLMITLCVFCVSGSVCLASVEPDITIAVRAKNLQQVKNLIAEGADVNERDEGEEQTPLMRAAQVGDTTIARLLLAHGAVVNTRDDFGHTALLFATQRGDTEMIKLLLQSGAHPEAQDLNALSMTRNRRHTLAAKLLLHTAARHTIASR